MAKMIAEICILILFSYFTGSIPNAYLAGKWFYKIDIREYGSGNVGVSNLIGATSWIVGLPVIFLDIGKGILPVWITHLLGMDIIWQVAVGSAAIIGHNWPIFLHFNGGRGMLTTLAVTFVLPVINGYAPWELLGFFVCAALSLVTIHNIPVGTGTGIAISPFVSWLTGKPLSLNIRFLIIFLILNNRRLTVPRSPEAANISTRELVLNRLLLDRDIKDRKMWLDRKAADKLDARHPKLM
jgi:glycerol-3-phosphate acyltransferase PlsY